MNPPPPSFIRDANSARNFNYLICYNNRATTSAIFGVATGSGLLFFGECLPLAKVTYPGVQHRMD